jgi:hypothetical protein
MTDLDPELIARAIAWCAAAGRQTTEEQVRTALAPLSWDALLAVKALLADPPPARPLGPHALADIARGAPAPAAAEREREGRYLGEEAFEARSSPPVSAPARGGRRRSPPQAAAVRVRRARQPELAPAPSPPALPLLGDLQRSEGRAVLERLIRRLGPRRSALAEALRAGWRRADGESIAETDVAVLLDHHGLRRAFERRERTWLLHALKAAGGVRPRAAARVGISAADFQHTIEQLGAAQEAEAVRDEWRADIRRRATLSERVRLLATDEERLADLGMLEQVLEDLRVRLPEHLKALRAVRPGSLAPALGRSLSLSRGDVDQLARRFGLDLEAQPPAAAVRSERATDTAPVRAPRRTTPHGGRRRPPPRR